jgi:hypothetical protein
MKSPRRPFRLRPEQISLVRRSAISAAVQVAARIEARPAAVNIRAGAGSTAVVGNLPSICGPTDRDVFPVDNPRKRPTSER